MNTFVIKSLEITIFSSAGYDTKGAILHLAEPIPEVIGSLPMAIPKYEGNVLSFETSKLIMTNVTELYVTDEVAECGTVTYEETDDGFIRITVSHLDVSLPRISDGKLLYPSRVWIVDKLFNERHIHKTETIRRAEALERFNKELNK